MTVPDDVLTIWLPVAVTALLAIIGLLRGVGRELVVAGAITLGALIVQQWGALWAVDVNDISPGISVGWAHFMLGLLILSVVTLFVGYLLGNRLVDAPLSASTRLLGGLLGALNGAALAGWVLRYAYVGLDARHLTANSVSDGFMIWAGWFPVVLAVLGSLYALISPLRRARAAVERPSAASDWTPTPVSAASDERVVAAPANPGSATIALPVSDSRAPLTGDTAVTEPVPIWDRPRADLPERVTEPVPLQSGLPASQEASWLGGKEPAPSTAPVSESVPATTALRASDSNEDLTSRSSNEAGKCANCGAEMLPGAAFCTNCGTRAG